MTSVFLNSEKGIFDLNFGILNSKFGQLDQKLFTKN